MFAQVSDAVSTSCAGFESCTSYSDFSHTYLTVFWLAAVAIGLVAALLGVALILRPGPREGRYQGQKSISYESGVDPVQTGWAQTQVRYYIFALLFVIFDVEAVFIFPWATRMEDYGTFGLIEMLLFIAILILGLVYAIRRKVLQWL
jgi:NADH:ubiquinone oxidoreductase subunit 3 (subunit A)